MSNKEKIKNSILGDINDNNKDIKKSKIEAQNNFLLALNADRRSIFMNNLIGGIAWGLGSVIGATIIVGILGLIIVNTKRVPILGDLVKVITEQIQSGANQLKK